MFTENDMVQNWKKAMTSDYMMTEEPSDLLWTALWPRPHSLEAPVHTRQTFPADLIGLDVVQVKYEPGNTLCR